MLTYLAIPQGDCFGRHDLDEARVDVGECGGIWCTMQGRRGLARRSTDVAEDESIVAVHAPAIAKYKRRSIGRYAAKQESASEVSRSPSLRPRYRTAPPNPIAAKLELFHYNSPPAGHCSALINRRGGLRKSYWCRGPTEWPTCEFLRWSWATTRY